MILLQCSLTEVYWTNWGVLMHYTMAD